MKKKLLIFIMLLTIVGYSLAQVISDFEVIPMNLMVGGYDDLSKITVVPNPDPSGINTSGWVAKFNRDMDGVPWGGFWCPLPVAVDVTVNKYVHVKVWKPRFSPVKFKLEGGAAGTIEIASMNPQATTGAWEDMVFDFTSKTGTYPVIAFMPDFMDPVGLTEDIVIYFDDIVVNNDPTPGSAPAYVMEDYEQIPLNLMTGDPVIDLSSMIIVKNPHPSGINASNYVVQFFRDKDGVPWEGFWSPTTVDVTTNKYMHVKVWKPRISPIKFKIEKPGEQHEVLSMNAQTVTNGWEDIVINFSAYTGAWTIIAFLPDFADPVGLNEDMIMYFDDIILNNYPAFYDSVRITGQPQNKTICINEPVSFSVQALSGVPLFYQWQKNQININNAIDSVFSIYDVNSTDHGLYRCIVSNAFDADTSYEAVLTVRDSVPPSQIFGSANIEELEISTYSVTAQPDHIYIFSIEGGSVINYTNNSVTVHWGLHGLGHVFLVEMNHEGCFGDTVILNINIMVHQIPKIIDNPVSQFVCEGEDVEFGALAVGMEPLNYQWQKDGVNIQDAINRQYMIFDPHFEDQGAYRCIVVNNNGADTSEAAYLTVETMPESNIYGPGNVDEYEVSNYYVIPQSYHLYNFSVIGGNEISHNENSITVQWLLTGYGYINLVESNTITGCIGDTVSVEVAIGNVGIDRLDDSNIKLYPNPTTGRFTLELKGEVSTDDVTVNIYSIWGEKVFTSLLSKERKHEFSLSDKPAGVYYISVIAGDKTETLKIILN